MFKLSLILLGAVVAVHSGDHHSHQGYFQYANVPAYGQYEFGYNRGNPHHYTSRYEQGHDWRFRTKVRWGDTKGNSYGEHYYDYNHVDKGSKGHKGHGGGYGHSQGHGGGGYGGHHQQSHGYGGHGHGHGHGWQPHHGSYSENSPAVLPSSNIIPK